MPNQLSKSAQRVQNVLTEHGFSFEVTELPDSTRTAEDAAGAVGCSVPQIAKSIIFKGGETGDPVLAVVSGSNRAGIAKLTDLAGEPIQNADADFVRERTGFSIGGVSPAGHTEEIQTFIDEDLLQYEEIWAAAGTPNAVFRLQPSDLPELTGGQVVDLKE